MPQREGTVSEMSEASDPTPDGDSPIAYDAITQLRTDATGFIDLVSDQALATVVPACPGWNLGDLTWHLAEVWHRWSLIVAQGITALDAVRALEQPQRPNDASLIAWARAAQESVTSAIVEADEQRLVWTWTGTSQPVAWAARRMAQETAVHRWDAANAVGSCDDIPAVVAADGIEEFLSCFAARRPNDAAEPIAGTVHLHCTDVGSNDQPLVNGEWLVTRLDESGIEFRREHAKGDVAIRGRANDLLLWLWRRDGGSVEILGDAAVAERFRAFASL